jgi:hypothetical protein
VSAVGQFFRFGKNSKQKINISPDCSPKRPIGRMPNKQSGGLAGWDGLSGLPSEPSQLVNVTFPSGT